jgi:hypothetical protein
MLDLVDLLSSFKSPLPFSSPLKSESVSESESSSRLGSLFVPIGGNGLEDVGNLTEFLEPGLELVGLEFGALSVKTGSSGGSISAVLFNQ